MVHDAIQNVTLFKKYIFFQRNAFTAKLQPVVLTMKFYQMPDIEFLKISNVVS